MSLGKLMEFIGHPIGILIVLVVVYLIGNINGYDSGLRDK